ncbi:MAG: pyrroline-5-carboxylate reductase [Phormidium sp. GEM2.Bin31]|nr:MAG: pyrroline-5-carboxylate reductase [Phormidium sp. GEM2.Bin31]
MSSSLAIIGGGMMAEAILSRLLAQQVYRPQAVSVGEPNPQRREYLAQTYQVQVSDNNASIAAEAQTLLLAIKPQIFAAVSGQLPPGTLSPQTLVISILAGTPLSKLEAAFPGSPVVRVMPNTPATVGAGISALSPGQGVTEEGLAVARKLLGAVGEVVEVPERLMDAVTGLSGSGPGYVALMVEALSDGGVAAGLPRATAQQLAIATLRGTAQLLSETGLHPGELKDRVTSPGGTTIAGIAQLEAQGLRSALISAVQAAAERSKALGNG